MNNWNEYQLGEIGFFNNGVNKSKNSFGHGFPFINLLDLFDMDRIEKKPKGLVAVNQDELNRYDLREGDILFVRSSVKLDGVGKACAVLRDLENTIYSGFVIRFRQTKPIIEKVFASYYLNSYDIRNQIISKASQSANTNINQENLKAIRIKLPPLSTQQRIAKILSTADAVIEKTQAAIAKYKAIKQGMLQDLFTRGVISEKVKVKSEKGEESEEVKVKSEKGEWEEKEVWTLRPRYEDAPHLYKESKLGMIPREWEVEESNQFVKFINGRAYALEEWETFGTPVIRLQNLTGSGDVYYYSNLQLPDEQYCNNGDLLYMWSATFGPYLWNGGKAIYHYHIWKVECSNKILQQYYYYDLLRFTQTVRNGASGSTMAHITKEGMEKRLTLMPPKDEQKLIAEKLGAIDSNIDTEQTYLQKMQSLKKGLMEDLLSGKKSLNL